MHSPVDTVDTGKKITVTEMENKEVVEPFESFYDDLILRRIGSFLPLEDATKASAVARRWKDLWQLSRHINLDESKFTLHTKRQTLLASVDDKHCPANGINLTGRSNFVALCRRFISLYRGEKVDTFRLHFSHPEEHHSDVEKLVRIAATKEVEMLVLDFSNPPNECRRFPYGFFHLPEVVYGLHESLHTLKLTGCIFWPARFGGIAALRSLTISRIELSQRSLEKLIANCQNLEYLSIVKLGALDFANIEDTKPPSLKTLVIEECFPLDYGIRIHAPRLQSLKYCGSLRAIMPENLRSLVDVEFDFRLEEDFGEFGDLLSQFLLQLSNTRVLSLCSYTVQVLPSGEEPLRLGSIDVLKHLILRKTALQREELPGIAFLLRSYTELESLTIEIGEPRRLNGYEYPYNPAPPNCRAFWDGQIVPFACMRRHLKTVVMEGFKGLENEMEFLRFILKKAHALQKMTISVSREDGGNLEHYRDAAALVVQNLQRASSSMAQVLVT